MKKMISRFFTLTMALMMLLSVSLSVTAAEYELASPESLLGKDLAAECAADGSSVTGSITSGDSAETAATADPIGIFVLRIRDGASTTAMGAFLMKNGTNYYLLTHEMAAVYALSGCELTLMGVDGKNHTAICVGVDNEYGLAYLYAEGMSAYAPLEFSREPFSTSVTVGLSYINSNSTAAKYVEYRAYDFARFTQLTDIYYGELDREVTLQWLGSPILPSKSSTEVQGICSAIQDENEEMYMAIITFEELSLESALSLAARPSEIRAAEDKPASTPASKPQPEPEPEPEPEPGMDKKYLVIGAIVAAAVAYYFYNNNKNNKKKEEEQQSQPSDLEFTIPAEPMLTHDVTKPMSDWVLRCTEGPMKGKSFPIGGKVMMGRSSKADIRFPDNTPGISGTHCELTLAGDHVILRDLNSSYGTFAGSKRIAPNTDHALYAGDSFTLAQGGPSFRLEGAGSNQKNVSLAVRAADGKIYRADASGKLTFGRNSGNNVQISGSDSAVSGKHCVLYYEGGNVYLKDLESTNGTFFSSKERLKPNKPYQVNKGTSFFLVKPGISFMVIDV